MSRRSTIERPRIVGRRVVKLALRRELDISALQDRDGFTDVWLRLYTPDAICVGTVHIKPASLRPLAEALTSLAAELGIAP